MGSPKYLRGMTKITTNIKRMQQCRDHTKLQNNKPVIYKLFTKIDTNRSELSTINHFHS